MCNQFTFHNQFGTDTGRSNFEQTDRQYSCCFWIPWTNHQDSEKIDWDASRLAWYFQKVEETSRRNILGRHQSCSEERIQVLSHTIERNHSLRYTPSLLFSEVFRKLLVGNWRSHLREGIHVTSASFKDLCEKRMEKRIGFRTRSTIRSWAAIQKFPIQPTNSKSKL